MYTSSSHSHNPKSWKNMSSANTSDLIFFLFFLNCYANCQIRNMYYISFITWQIQEGKCVWGGQMTKILNEMSKVTEMQIASISSRDKRLKFLFTFLFGEHLHCVLFFMFNFLCTIGLSLIWRLFPVLAGW